MPKHRIVSINMLNTSCLVYKITNFVAASLYPDRSLMINPLVCPRTDTVLKLAAILDKMEFVHVCGTQASGKSYLFKLLGEYYRKERRKVFSIDMWEDLNSAEPWGSLVKLLTKWDRDLGAVNSMVSWDLKSNVVILVDEAQRTYSDTGLWNIILKEKQGSACPYKFRLCLFCSYGIPSTGRDETFFTPVRLSRGQCISLTPQNEPQSPPIGLFYSREEFKDTVSRICMFYYREKFNLDEDSQDYIFAITNGHPGGVESLTSVLFQVRSE